MTSYRPIEWAEWLAHGITEEFIHGLREMENSALDELTAKHTITGKSADEIAVKVAALNGRINAVRDIIAGLEDLAQENADGQD